MTEKEEIQHLRNEIEILKKENLSFQSNDKMFQALVETAVGDIGEEYFNNIVIKLSEWLNAECVIIGQMIEPNVVEGFPMYLDGKIVHGFRYELYNTPCDLTSKKGYCVYPENVIDAFPKSKDLLDLNIEGYMGTALYNKNGEPNGILCAMSRMKLDLPPQAEKIMKIVAARISAEIERIKAQKALLISEEKLRAANASKDKLFSIIAHDLKSPFNALIGFSRVLLTHLKNNDIADIDKYAKIIHDVAVQTHRLLENLLEWSVVQTNRNAFVPVKFNLSDLLTEVIDLYKNQARQKGITLTPAIKPNVEMVADRNMVTTVLRNLISNAVKYTRSGGVITVAALSQEEMVKLIISDTGVGIQKDHINKLFAIDTKITTAGTNNERGTGLGLVLCKELVEKHSGKIWVESEPGSGSKFFITIPQNNNLKSSGSTDSPA
ncbi:MAG: HAMP domain-containing sensor histidine kinase [Bacteroidales bacterium]